MVRHSERITSLSLAVLLCGLGGLAAARAAADDGGEVVYEVADPDGIYYGSGKHPDSPGVMDVQKVWDEIPEYKQIIEEELTEEDAKYHLLMAKATERFNKALEKLAGRDGHDMLGEVGAIVAKSEDAKKIPDVTKEMIKLVTRE